MGWFSKQKPVTLQLFRSRATINRFSAAIVTDFGNVRTNNEDGALICFPREEAVLKNKGCLFVLADGMGGHNCGEVASELALEAFSNAYFNAKGNVLKSLKNAVGAANSYVYKAALTHPKYAGMGTTLTAVLVKNEALFLAHVGDSRAYILNENFILKISKDQTLVQQLLDLGEITASEAAVRPDRNVLLHALGTQPNCFCEVVKINTPLGDDDVLMLCSDGLYDLVADEEIKRIADNCANIEEMGNALVQQAKRNGGYDNITVLLATKIKQPSIPQLKNTGDYEIYLSKETSTL